MKMLPLLENVQSRMFENDICLSIISNSLFVSHLLAIVISGCSAVVTFDEFFPSFAIASVSHAVSNRVIKPTNRVFPFLGFPPHTILSFPYVFLRVT